MSYSDGDQVKIGDYEITLGARKGSSGVRWTWFCSQVGVGSEGRSATPDLAVADAVATLGGSACRHGAPSGQFCHRCHDSEM
jgi:hypothetical protein